MRGGREGGLCSSISSPISSRIFEEILPLPLQIRFVCFNAQGGAEAAARESPEQHIANAKALVAGWGWGLEQAVALTRPESVSRSRQAVWGCY